MASSNRASFKSVLSRQNSYYSCGEPDTEADNVRAGLVNEGFQVWKNYLFIRFISLDLRADNYFPLSRYSLLSSWMNSRFMKMTRNSV